MATDKSEWERRARIYRERQDWMRGMFLVLLGLAGGLLCGIVWAIVR